MNLVGIGKHLPCAFRKHLGSTWLHLTSLLLISLGCGENQPTNQPSGRSWESVFWAWTYESMAVGPMVIWSLHATWCCWCVHGLFWIGQVHHSISSMNGLLELSLGTGFSLLIGSRFLCVFWLGPCCIFEQPSWEAGGGQGWGGGKISFSMDYATDIWGNMSDVYIALMKMLSHQKRHSSCLSCLLNILTSPNNQCMKAPLHIRAEKTRCRPVREESNRVGSLGDFTTIPWPWWLPWASFSCKTCISLKIPESQQLYSNPGHTGAPRLSKRDKKQASLCFIFYPFVCFLRPLSFTGNVVLDCTIWNCHFCVPQMVEYWQFHTGQLNRQSIKMP